MSHFEKLKIKSFNFWELYLNENQCYLGRLCLFYKSRNSIDLFDLDNEKLLELKEIMNLSKAALHKLFQPNKINYSCLCNVCHALHLHIVPRYKDLRWFNGVAFTDDNWGKNYAPYNKEFKVSDSLLEKLKQEFWEAMLL
ncbi:MAG: hypothetical protein HZB76_01555 [Chlamydiae bacterium]|nr:hypothetical protein [Chlamydiota bacterium]